MHHKMWYIYIYIYIRFLEDYIDGIFASAIYRAKREKNNDAITRMRRYSSNVQIEWCKTVRKVVYVYV